MPIQVYVVDDSAVVRQTLQHLLSGDPDIALLGSAPRPKIAIAGKDRGRSCEKLSCHSCEMASTAVGKISRKKWSSRCARLSSCACARVGAMVSPNRMNRSAGRTDQVR
jgi:hypothetical protein